VVFAERSNISASCQNLWCRFVNEKGGRAASIAPGKIGVFKRSCDDKKACFWQQAGDVSKGHEFFLCGGSGRRTRRHEEMRGGFRRSEASPWECRIQKMATCYPHFLIHASLASLSLKIIYRKLCCRILTKRIMFLLKFKN
jgi:hypothetical protein